MKRKFLINKMFVGSFGDQNITHEVINYYLPDNDDNIYVYVAPYGFVGTDNNEKEKQNIIHLKKKEFNHFLYITEEEFIEIQNRIEPLLKGCIKTERINKKTIIEKAQLSSFNLSDQDFSIEREKTIEVINKNNKKQKGKLDLYISSENYSLIIENKIKSDLNGKVQNNDTSQLDLYTKWQNKGKQNITKKIFLFQPNYNHINCPKNVVAIYYSDIYSFFENITSEKNKSETYNFALQEFKNILIKHKRTRKEEIETRFFNVINL